MLNNIKYKTMNNDNNTYQHIDGVKNNICTYTSSDTILTIEHALDKYKTLANKLNITPNDNIEYLLKQIGKSGITLKELYTLIENSF